ncbi:MAG TPA: hypothetical protein VK988_02590 [Acidimicrobiales bacterium]|nr:hypothetical protein [Acidimicrobiales bacterium]
MREELAICRLGPIPHSKFVGWHDVDQAKAVAYERWLAGHCRSCGQRRADWEDENGQLLMDAPFEVVDYICGGCEALDDHRKLTKDAPGERHGYHQAFRPVRWEQE